MTRPAPDHRDLVGRLNAQGVPTIHCPAFELESEPEQRLLPRLADLAEHDLAIVTSPFAARLLARYLNLRGNLAGAGIRDVRFVAPGRGTAAELESAGITAVFPAGGGTSEEILALAEFENVRGKRIAIVGAPGGRGVLVRELAARGARMEELHVYRRKALAPCPALIEALRRGDGLVNLVSSAQAFRTIMDLLPDQLRPAWLGTGFIASSSRIEQVCRDAGVRRIWRADGASDDAMLSAAAEADWLAG